MGSVAVDSASKHGIEDGDVLHAYRNPIRVFDPGDVVMPIGADRTGRLAEIGVAEGGGIEFVVHAMHARPRFLR